MKKSTTTFKKPIKAAILAAIVIMVGLFAVQLTPQSVNANSYDDQIRAFEEQIASYKKQAEEAHSRANTLQAEVNSLNAQKSTIQAQINLSQAKHDKLVSQIKETENKINKMRDVLGDVLAELYVDSEISPLEMLATSKSMSDYMDKQQYQNTIRNKLNGAIKEIKILKTKLDQQKKDVEKVIADQKAQRAQLAEKEAEKQGLLATTRGEEATYQSMIKKLQAEKEKAEAALAASLSNGSYKVAPVGYVRAGDIVGAVGNTGLSSGPHLHLEVRQGGSTRNPANYIKRQPIDMPPGYISQEYWNYDQFYIGGHHPGTDYATAQGYPIYAIDSGNLYRGCSDQILNTSGNPYGYVAIVEHPSGAISVYAHMSNAPSACNYNTYY